MKTAKTVWMSWSTGKDSAAALWKLSKDPAIHVKALVTTLNQDYQRVAMHATRKELLKLQAQALGLPVKEVMIPKNCSNQEYEKAFKDLLTQGEQQDIQAIAFGDLFLEDVRDYRINLFKQSPLEALFPLWQTPTHTLAHDLIRSGFRAFITCVDPKVLPASLAGRTYDESFLQALPPQADPCGENGEFHTFVFDAPIFQHPIPCHAGEIVQRDGFVFADVVPA